MALGQILAGNIIYADDLQDELDELTALRADKTADGATFPSNTTLANDEDLFLSVVARKYEMDAAIVYDAGGTADIKLAWTFPSATFYYTAWTVNTAGGVVPIVSAAEASGTAKSFGGLGIGTPTTVWYRGFVTFTAAGTLRLQRAQNVSTAENTRVKAGSWLRLRPAI